MSPSVLIVEDEPLILIMIEQMISDLGYTVSAAASATEAALEAIAATVPDLAVLDVNLGATTSLPVVQMCRKLGVPVVFITGYAQADLPDHCDGAPVLFKPFDPDELGSAIAGLLAQAEPRYLRVSQ